MPVRRLLVPLLLTLAVLAGCGGADEARQPAGTPVATDPPNLLTADLIDREAGGSDDPEAARAVLEFWRDVQYSNFPRAYERLSPGLQGTVSYRRFVRAFNAALPLFQYRPRVQSVESDGDEATVYLLVQDGSQPSPRDTPLAFNLDRATDGWRLSTDPRNVLGTSSRSG